jgi:hypothetical protein
LSVCVTGVAAWPMSLFVELNRSAVVGVRPLFS